jgi:uncharacterized protein
MSAKNVDTVRAMYAAYARGDFATGLSYLDPSIEFSQPEDEPGGGTYHGHEGVIQAFTKWTGAWDGYHVEVEELSDLGADVLARTRHFGRGKDSGVEVEMEIFQLWTLHDGKVVRARMYYNEADARAAATASLGVSDGT